MALYKNPAYLASLNSDEFDKLHTPGTATPHSGIYRCTGCGDEIASNKGNPLPPQNHHQHNSSQGNIRWQMIVFSQSK